MASKNIISCRLASYGRYGDLAYEHLKKIGIDHIELTIPDPEKVGLVLEELEKHDLALGSLQALCDIHKENIRREFKPIVEIAASGRVQRTFLEESRITLAGPPRPRRRRGRPGEDQGTSPFRSQIPLAVSGNAISDPDGTFLEVW